VKLWSVESYKEISTLKVQSNDFSPFIISIDGKFLASENKDNMIKL
jgi:hypothetical protein